MVYIMSTLRNADGPDDDDDHATDANVTSTATAINAATDASDLSIQNNEDHSK